MQMGLEAATKALLDAGMFNQTSVPPIFTLAKALHTIPLKPRLWATAMATPQLVKYVVFLSLSEIDTELVHRDPSVHYTTSGSHISRLLT